jgi:hypothetical protein
MRHSNVAVAVLGIVLGAASVSTQACDPEKATLELFRRQGLNLLKPARDYIDTGGLVVRRGKGPLEYIDPLDLEHASSVGDDAFAATILSEARKSTARFEFALNLIKQILPGSLDVAGESERELTLDQIDATGKRLPDGAVKTLIQRQATAAEINDDLKQGLDVFVVQEVYSATGMQVSASDKKALSVKYGSGAEVQACPATTSPDAPKPGAAKSGAGEKAQPGQGEKGQPTSDEKKSEPSKPVAKPSATQSSGRGQGSGGAQGSGGQGSGGGQASGGQAAGGGDAKPAIGFGLCKTGAYTLKFSSAKPGQFMPFAVRLKQIELRDGKLAIKRGGVAPGGSLGTGATEYMLVDEQAPVISGLTRRPPRK